MKGRDVPDAPLSHAVYDKRGHTIQTAEPALIDASAYQRPWGGPVKWISPRQRRKQMRAARQTTRGEK